MVCRHRGTGDGMSLRAAEEAVDKEEWPTERKSAMWPVAG